jgi:hypothetical protein
MRCAPMPLRAQWLWNSPLEWGGLRWYHVSPDSGPRFLAGMSSDVIPCPTTLNPPSCRGGLQCYTCHAIFYAVRDSYIKKGIADLLTQLGSHGFKACSHIFKACPRVSKAPDTRAIIACKTCSQAAPSWPARRADMRLQCSTDSVDHSKDIATVRAIRQDGAILLTVHDVAERLDTARPMPLKTLLATPIL